MPRVFDKVYELLGTGSIPATDALGNTSGYGGYTATGIDFWSLPGLITPMPHNGVFKRGPIALFTTSDDRRYWWAAKIQNATSSVLEIYSVSTVGSTLRYTSSVMPGMPRSFDFEMNHGGHIVAVADIDGQLYGYYSFSSSLNWQLIATSSFTPKLVYAGQSCSLVYANNDFAKGGWYPEIHTDTTDAMFPKSSSVFYPTAPYDNALLNIPDSLVTQSVTDENGGYWGWSGSFSGTLSGIFTGSMIGHLTGTFNDGPFGSAKLMTPSLYYGTLVGEMTGIFGGNFIGTAIGTGSMYGFLSGYFGGTYYTVVPDTGSLVIPTTQPMSAAPTGNNWLVGNISGTLIAGSYPTSQSAVKPIYFINDFVATKSNRLQLTYGRYDPIAQQASYTTSLSPTNVTTSPVADAAGGGVPFAVELYPPIKTIVPRFQDSEAAFSGLPGLGSIGGVVAATPSMVSAWSLTNDYGFTYYFNYTVGNIGGIGGLFRYLSNTSNNGYPNTFQYVRGEGGGGHGGSVPGSAPTIFSGSYIHAMMFQSASWYQKAFDGTHHTLIADTDHNTIAMRYSSYQLIPFGYDYTIVSQSFGLDNGVNPVATNLWAGVKLRPMISEPTATLTVQIVPTSPEYFFSGSVTGSQRTLTITTDHSMIILPLSKSIQYADFTTNVSTDITGSNNIAPEWSPTWYPNVTLYMHWSGNITGKQYDATMSCQSYLLDANLGNQDPTVQGYSFVI